MGVYRTDYLMFGINVGADKFSWDDHVSEVEGTSDRRFDVVYDGMSGKYCIAGVILSSIDQYEGLIMKEITTDMLNIDKTKLASKISEAFKIECNKEDIKLYAFSHYT